jgi:hypothetical protein
MMKSGTLTNELRSKMKEKFAPGSKKSPTKAAPEPKKPAPKIIPDDDENWDDDFSDMGKLSVTFPTHHP